MAKQIPPVDVDDLKARFEALGMLTYSWNQCEAVIPMMFFTLFRLPQDWARIISHDLPMPSLCRKLLDFIAANPIDTDTDDAITYGVNLFDVNRINRNQLTHFFPARTSNGLQMFRDKGPDVAWLAHNQVEWDAATLRRVVGEVAQCHDYLMALQLRLVFRHMKGPLKPLRDKPPLPKSLWSPPPRSNPKPPRQPKPSQA